MDYENFKEKFVDDLRDKLYESGAEVDLSVHTVNKLNESYEAITVTPEGSNIGVNIGIDKFYEALDNGKSYDEVLSKAVEVVENGISQRPDFDINSLSDYSQMKEKLAMRCTFFCVKIRRRPTRLKSGRDSESGAAFLPVSLRT